MTLSGYFLSLEHSASSFARANGQSLRLNARESHQVSTPPTGYVPRDADLKKFIQPKSWELCFIWQEILGLQMWEAVSQVNLREMLQVI